MTVVFVNRQPGSQHCMIIAVGQQPQWRYFLHSIAFVVFGITTSTVHMYVHTPHIRLQARQSSYFPFEGILSLLRFAFCTVHAFCVFTFTTSRSILFLHFSPFLWLASSPIALIATWAKVSFLLSHAFLFILVDLLFSPLQCFYLFFFYLFCPFVFSHLFCLCFFFQNFTFLISIYSFAFTYVYSSLHAIARVAALLEKCVGDCNFLIFRAWLGSLTIVAVVFLIKNFIKAEITF